MNGTTRGRIHLRTEILIAVLGFLFGLYSPLVGPVEAFETRNIELVWSVPPEQDVAGYIIYYGPVSRYEEDFDEYPYMENLLAEEVQVEDNKVHYVLTSLDADLTYWVSVTAYDHDGNESTYSNEKEVGVSSGPSPAVAVEADSGGCQTVAGAPDWDRGGGSALIGWGSVFLLVPAWILVLRKRLPRGILPS